MDFKSYLNCLISMKFFSLHLQEVSTLAFLGLKRLSFQKYVTDPLGLMFGDITSEQAR